MANATVADLQTQIDHLSVQIAQADTDATMSDDALGRVVAREQASILREQQQQLLEEQQAAKLADDASTAAAWLDTVEATVTAEYQTLAAAKAELYQAGSDYLAACQALIGTLTSIVQMGSQFACALPDRIQTTYGGVLVDGVRVTVENSAPGADVAAVAESIFRALGNFGWLSDLLHGVAISSPGGPVNPFASQG